MLIATLLEFNKLVYGSVWTYFWVLLLAGVFALFLFIVGLIWGRLWLTDLETLCENRQSLLVPVLTCRCDGTIINVRGGLFQRMTARCHEWKIKSGVFETSVQREKVQTDIRNGFWDIFYKSIWETAHGMQKGRNSATLPILVQLWHGTKFFPKQVRRWRSLECLSWCLKEADRS